MTITTILRTTKSNSLAIAFSLLAGLTLPQSAVAQSGASVSPSTVEYRYSGSDGSLVYQWIAPAYGYGNTLGSILIKPNLQGSSIQEIDLHPAAVSPLGTTIVQSATWSHTSGIYSLCLLISASGHSTRLYITPALKGKVLSVHVTADSAIISQLEIGKWPSTIHTESITVPYYSQPLTSFPDLELFANTDFDWTISHATTVTTNMAIYQPLTNGSLNNLNETFRIAISENITDTFPSIPNPPSPYMSQQAGRMIVDVTKDVFTTMTHGFYSFGQISMTRCQAVVHGWQFGGYDNELPGTYPASYPLGGDSALKAVSASARATGCLFSLHENYADYYPNYPSFNKASISLLANGTLKDGWFNPDTQIQSYSTKPTWMVRNATTQSPLIHEGYATNASYIDVSSAALVGIRNDMDASETGAGTLAAGMLASKNLFQYERQTHGGPVVGEGGYHWYYSGLLDGVEAQTGATTSGNLGETLPLFVDFDLLRIHPLQVNHGMGRYERWFRPGTAMTSLKLMDAYRMQEIAFGHAPYLGYQYWTNTPYTIQEQSLVSPLSQRYGTKTATLIQYQVNGLWVNTNAAVKANDFSRVEVTYSNGDRVVANAQAGNLVWNGLTIPQYGWASIGSGLLAYTALQGGLVVDYAQTPTSFFANARSQSDYQLSGMAQPQVTHIVQLAPYDFTIQLNWNVLQDFPPSEARAFIHFVKTTNTSNGIAFQADYSPSTPTSKWKTGNAIQDRSVGVNLSASTPDGQYTVRLGLATTDDGARLVLAGLDDGSTRYIVGTLTIANSGKSITFNPQAAPAADARLNANPATVNFGSIQTDGMVRIQQTSIGSSAAAWQLRVFPATRNVTVRLSAATIPPPASLICDGNAVTPVLLQGGAYWQSPIKGSKMCTWPVN